MGLAIFRGIMDLEKGKSCAIVVSGGLTVTLLIPPSTAMKLEGKGTGRKLK